MNGRLALTKYVRQLNLLTRYQVFSPEVMQEVANRILSMPEVTADDIMLILCEQTVPEGKEDVFGAVCEALTN